MFITLRCQFARYYSKGNNTIGGYKAMLKILVATLDSHWVKMDTMHKKRRERSQNGQ